MKIKCNLQHFVYQKILWVQLHFEICLHLKMHTLYIYTDNNFSKHTYLNVKKKIFI